MTAERMADTRQCPYCRAWIPMPARFARRAFEAHKAACSNGCQRCGDPSTPQHQDVLGRPHSCPNNPTSPYATVKQGALL